MLEKYIQKQITDYLQVLENQGKLVYLRNNSIASKIIRPNGKTGFIKNNKPGAADIIVFLKRGKTLFIEVKNEKGKMSESQLKFKVQVEELGHYYLLARSLEDVTDNLKGYI